MNVRVRDCGRVPVGKGVVLRLRDGMAGYSGLATCGSVWSCPVCSAKILVRRAFEIGAVLGEAQAQGYKLAFGTLTMRHRRGQSLDHLWGAARKAWTRAISGKAWKGAQKRAGIVGWVRVWEVTTGPNGWHVHVHFVLILDESADSGTVEDVCSGMFGRWSSGLQAVGLEAPLRKGQEWHLVGGESGGIAEYLAKITDGTIAGPDALGLELTHVSSGRARSDLRTQPVWSILADLDETGETSAWRRWGEWEKGSKGKRQVGWMAGTRKRFGLVEPEMTDLELALVEVGTEDDGLVFFEAAGWAVLVHHWRRLTQLLDAAEVAGLQGVRELLDGWGDVPYLVLVEDPV